MATQTLYAGYLMDVCLRCIFGHKWTDIPNTLPASSGTTSRKLLAFFILCKFPSSQTTVQVDQADLLRVHSIP
jgi:NCS1 family nucleobase:cation symporter-1